jgi:hypothetical protein
VTEDSHPIPVSATAFRRTVAGSRISEATVAGGVGHVARLKLDLLDEGGVCVAASPGHQLAFERVDTQTFAAGGEMSGDVFVQLLKGLVVGAVSVLGDARTGQAWSVILNPGPPCSFVIRAGLYPSASPGLAFLAEARTAELRHDVTTDSYSYITGELTSGRLFSPNCIAP